MKPDVGLLLRQQFPQLGVVILSNHDNPYFLSAVPRATIGGWRFFQKRSVSDAETIQRAIEATVAGHLVLGRQLVMRRHARLAAQFGHLSENQQSLLTTIAQGYGEAALTKQFGVSPAVVAELLNDLYKALRIPEGGSSTAKRVQATLLYLGEG